jgi:hypothetical protein
VARPNLITKDRIAKVSLLLISSTICFLMVESVIRTKGTYNSNGTFVLGTVRLRPHGLPVGAMRKRVADYIMSTRLAMVYDSLLGWTPQRNGRSRDGLFAYNSAGIRTDPSSPRDYSISPPKAVLRIALFGDSFTRSDEVPFSASWGHYLEEQLSRANIDSEVLNFGVGSYGMGQAFLRYKEVGRRFSPQIVIFGFQAENARRNLTILRPFLERDTSFPFSTPRFVLDHNDLRLLNSPTVPPENVVEIIEGIEGWGLRAHEYFYDPADYRERAWLKSKSLSLGWAFLLSNRWTRPKQAIEFYSLQNEPALLSLRIIEEFRTEAESNQSMFLTVHLPTKPHLLTLLNDSELPYAELLERVGDITDLIDPQRALLGEAKASSIESLFSGHYSALGNKIVADVVARAVIARHDASDLIVN